MYAVSTCSGAIRRLARNLPLAACMPSLALARTAYVTPISLWAVSRSYATCMPCAVPSCRCLHPDVWNYIPMSVRLAAYTCRCLHPDVGGVPHPTYLSYNVRQSRVATLLLILGQIPDLQIHTALSPHLSVTSLRISKSMPVYSVDTLSHCDPTAKVFVPSPVPREVFRVWEWLIGYSSSLPSYLNGEALLDPADTGVWRYPGEYMSYPWGSGCCPPEMFCVVWRPEPASEGPNE